MVHRYRQVCGNANQASLAQVCKMLLLEGEIELSIRDFPSGRERNIWHIIPKVKELNVIINLAENYFDLNDNYLGP